MFNSWVGVLINSQVSNTGPSNTTTETSVLPAAAKFTIPANFFSTVGTAVRITMAAAVSNVASTPGTLNMKVKLGSTIAFDGGTQQLSTTVHTSLPYVWQCLLTLQVIGASAAFKGQAWAMGQMCLRSGADLATDGLEMSPNTAPANSATWDSTASQVLDLTATHSVSTSGTSTTSHQYVVEVLN